MPGIHRGVLIWVHVVAFSRRLIPLVALFIWFTGEKAQGMPGWKKMRLIV
jgi:hypothetical protein